MEIPEGTCHKNEGRERPFIERNTEEGGYPEKERRKETVEKPSAEVAKSKLVIKTVRKLSQERKAREITFQDSGIKMHKNKNNQTSEKVYLWRMNLRLEKSFKKFYGRYHDVIEKYQRSVKVIVND